MKKTMYAVLRFHPHVRLEDRQTGQVKDFKISGLDGFIPVFLTKKAAVKAAGKKYEIIKLSTF